MITFRKRKNWKKYSVISSFLGYCLGIIGHLLLIQLKSIYELNNDNLWLISSVNWLVVFTSITAGLLIIAGGIFISIYFGSQPYIELLANRIFKTKYGIEKLSNIIANPDKIKSIQKLLDEVKRLKEIRENTILVYCWSFIYALLIACIIFIFLNFYFPETTIYNIIGWPVTIAAGLVFIIAVPLSKESKLEKYYRNLLKRYQS